MLANIIGITLSTGAFIAFAYFMLQDLREVERRCQAAKRDAENAKLEESYQANIAAEWRG